MKTILLITRILLVGLMLSAGIATVGAANLTLEKRVTGSEPGYPVSTVTWLVNVSNLDPTPIDVNVTEILPSGCVVVANETTCGTYTGSIWNVTVGGESTESLTLTTDCRLSCNPAGSVTVKNRVEITSPDVDEDASATIAFDVPTCMNVTVKPETMNARTLNIGGNGSVGKGVATVFITVGDLLNRRDVTRDSIAITCNNATPEKIHFNKKDNGTLMLKFRRGAFKFDSPVGDTVWINCSGNVTLRDGTVLKIEGGDQVRVTKSGKSFVEQFLQLIGLAKDKDAEEEREARKVAEMQAKYDEHFDALNRSIQCGLLPATVNMSDLHLDISAYTNQTEFTPAELLDLLEDILNDAEFEENYETAKDMIEDAKDIADKISNQYGRGKGYWGNRAVCPPQVEIEKEQDEEEPECTVDADCDDNETCKRGECERVEEHECNADKDCEEGYTCRHHECEEDERPECTDDEDCEADESCVRGECERRD